MILIIIGTSSVLVYSTLSSRNEDFAQLGLESYVLHARIFSLKIIQLTTSYSSAFTLFDASWIGIHLFTYLIIEFLHPLGFSLTFFMLYILFGFSYLFCIHKTILYNTFLKMILFRFLITLSSCPHIFLQHIFGIDVTMLYIFRLLHILTSCYFRLESSHDVVSK